MDDGSEVDVPATASQDSSLPAVTHAHRQPQVLTWNKSTSACQSICTSTCTVPDDEEEATEEDLSDQEDESEDKDDLYPGIDSAALGNKLTHFDDNVLDLCCQQSGIDKEDDLKLQYEDEVEVVEAHPKKKASEPSDFGEDELAEETCTPLVAGQKRKYQHNLAPWVLSVSKEFPDASYHHPAVGQVLGITDQPDRLCMVLSYTVCQVIQHAISKSTYIKMARTNSTLCKVFIQTTCSLGQNVFADCMKVNVSFQKNVARMLSNHLSGFQSSIKNSVTIGMVWGWYNLDGTDMKTKAVDLIKHEKYILPPSHDGFFTVERGACLVQKHAECFKSSIPEHEECEVMAPVAVFAATCIHATLKQITSDGHHQCQTFSMDQFEGVYDTHIKYLNGIHSKSLPKYHCLMADLYKAALTQVNQRDLGQASIDIEGMSE
ncbi:hypothetical protein BJV74DRAFT_794362 [Russula compacta]|nr:hypothetical protein BJV74DRAFT_794362 [Russula compacta]